MMGEGGGCGVVFLSEGGDGVGQEGSLAVAVHTFCVICLLRHIQLS